MSSLDTAQPMPPQPTPMTADRRDAILLRLVDRLENHGSWCGTTHIQKATYLLQRMTGIDLGFEFVLYKHGPYSFDLSEGLATLRADRLLEAEVRHEGYGASLLPTRRSRALTDRFSDTLDRHAEAIDFVASRLGSRGVAELEQVATALLVSEERGWDASIDDRAARLRAIKPHIEPADARSAVEEVDGMRGEWLAARA